MDFELFNHKLNCRCCFASFGQSGAAGFKITQTVRKKFHKLTQIELRQTRDSSNLICESCNFKLADVCEFQQRMIDNQRRLKEFRKTMNPVVVLERIENEHENDWQDCDPFLSTIIKNEPEENIKEEIMNYEDNNSRTWENLEQMFIGDVSVIKPESSNEHKNSTKRIRKQTVKQFVPKENKPRPKNARKKRVKPKVPRVKAFSCDHCEYKAVRKYDVFEHLQKHLMKEVRKRYPCSYCEKTYTLKCNVNAHERMCHSGVVKEFKCGPCDRVFKSFGGLYTHKKTQHGGKRDDKAYPCSKCDKTYPTKGALKQHVQFHHEPRRPCEICGKMVVPGSEYTRHVKAHSKIHQCPHPGCDREFSRSFSVLYHYKTVHTPVKPVSCPICNVTFAAEVRLNIHIRAQHKVEKVKCILPECDFKTPRKVLLVSHYEKHTEVDRSWRKKFQQHLTEVKFRVHPKTFRQKTEDIIQNLNPSDV